MYISFSKYLIKYRNQVMGVWWIIKLETQCLRQKNELETQGLRLGLGFLVFVRMIWIGLVGWSEPRSRLQILD